MGNQPENELNLFGRPENLVGGADRMGSHWVVFQTGRRVVEQEPRSPQRLVGHPIAVRADESSPHGPPAGEGLLGRRRRRSPTLSLRPLECSATVRRLLAATRRAVGTPPPRVSGIPNGTITVPISIPIDNPACPRHTARCSYGLKKGQTTSRYAYGSACRSRDPLEAG